MGTRRDGACGKNGQGPQKIKGRLLPTPKPSVYVPVDACFSITRRLCVVQRAGWVREVAHFSHNNRSSRYVILFQGKPFKNWMNMFRCFVFDSLFRIVFPVLDYIYLRVFPRFLGVLVQKLCPADQPGPIWTPLTLPWKP
jgi:hypothetical protein